MEKFGANNNNPPKHETASRRGALLGAALASGLGGAAAADSLTDSYDPAFEAAANGTTIELPSTAPEQVVAAMNQLNEQIESFKQNNERLATALQEAQGDYRAFTEAQMQVYSEATKVMNEYLVDRRLRQVALYLPEGDQVAMREDEARRGYDELHETMVQINQIFPPYEESMTPDEGSSATPDVSEAATLPYEMPSTELENEFQKFVFDSTLPLDSKASVAELISEISKSLIDQSAIIESYEGSTMSDRIQNRLVDAQNNQKALWHQLTNKFIEAGIDLPSQFSIYGSQPY